MTSGGHFPRPLAQKGHEVSRPRLYPSHALEKEGQAGPLPHTGCLPFPVPGQALWGRVSQRQPGPEITGAQGVKQRWQKPDEKEDVSGTGVVSDGVRGKMREGLPGKSGSGREVMGSW